MLHVSSVSFVSRLAVVAGLVALAVGGSASTPTAASARDYNVSGAAEPERQVAYDFRIETRDACEPCEAAKTYIISGGFSDLGIRIVHHAEPVEGQSYPKFRWRYRDKTGRVTGCWHLGFDTSADDPEAALRDCIASLAAGLDNPRPKPVTLGRRVTSAQPPGSVVTERVTTRTYTVPQVVRYTVPFTETYVQPAPVMRYVSPPRVVSTRIVRAAPIIIEEPPQMMMDAAPVTYYSAPPVRYVEPRYSAPVYRSSYQPMYRPSYQPAYRTPAYGPRPMFRGGGGGRCPGGICPPSGGGGFGLRFGMGFGLGGAQRSTYSAPGRLNWVPASRPWHYRGDFTPNRGAIIAHLVNDGLHARHGWTRAELQQLTTPQLWALHSADHEGKAG